MFGRRFFQEATQFKAITSQDFKLVANIFFVLLQNTALSCANNPNDHLSDIWIKVYKKKGQELEGKYKGYHKSHNVLEFYLNGMDNKSCSQMTTTDKRIIIYTTDILGNRYVRLDTNKII